MRHGGGSSRVGDSKTLEPVSDLQVDVRDDGLKWLEVLSMESSIPFVPNPINGCLKRYEGESPEIFVGSKGEELLQSCIPVLIWL